MNEQNYYYHSARGMLLGSRAREQLIIEEMKNLGKNDFFIDIGCAQGYYLEKAFQHCENVFGLEYEIQSAKRNPKKFSVVNAGAEEIPFKKNSFEFVLCSEVLEHVPDWKKAVKELKRIGRKKILVTIPLEKSLFWRTFSKFAGMETRGHLHRLESKDIEQEMLPWRLEKKVLVHTPSRRINKKISKRLSEKKAMYSVMLFKK